jgi:hypothetical protein
VNFSLVSNSQAILLTVGSSESCSVSVEGINQAPPSCFSRTDNTPCSTGGVKGDTEGNSGVVVAGVVSTCIVVLVMGLALIVVGVASWSRRHGVSTQRPKSIHLHHRLPHGGDSVTSFSPADSGSALSLLPLYNILSLTLMCVLGSSIDIIIIISLL